MIWLQGLFLLPPPNFKLCFYFHIQTDLKKKNAIKDSFACVVLSGMFFSNMYTWLPSSPTLDPCSNDTLAVELLQKTLLPIQTTTLTFADVVLVSNVFFWIFWFGFLVLTWVHVFIHLLIFIKYQVWYDSLFGPGPSPWTASWHLSPS